jgi:hypothetical protein
MVRLPSEHEAKAILAKAAHEFLTELADFPSKIRDPDWLKVVEADGQGQEDGKPLRPSSGQEIKHEQEKAKRRRKAKTATMRKLRAKLDPFLARAQTMDVIFRHRANCDILIVSSARGFTRGPLLSKGNGFDLVFRQRIRQRVGSIGDFDRLLLQGNRNVFLHFVCVACGIRFVVFPAKRCRVEIAVIFDGIGMLQSFRWTAELSFEQQLHSIR